MLELGIKFLISYLIGSLMGSMIMGRLKGGVDIRTMGSGNAGGTNALRTQGAMFAVGVMIVDIGKGILAPALIPGLEIPGVAADPELPRICITLACAAGVVVGHVWPIWHKFRGGKGAATLVGTIIVLMPEMVLPILLIWAWMLVILGYVGLATMTAAAAAPLYVALMRLPHDQALFYYCVAMALFMIFSHRSNIHRMWRREEPRNDSLMVFRKKKQDAGDGPS